MSTHWDLSWRADPRARALADRHYNRQKVGAAQFVPPGRCLVLITPAADAFWVTSWPFAQYVKHAWPGAWICSAFRREGGARASDLIRSAVAATRWLFGDPPPNGMVTFVDTDKVRRKRDPGRCYYKGWIQARWAYKGRPCRLATPRSRYASAGGAGRSPGATSEQTCKNMLTRQATRRMVVFRRV